MLLQQPQHMLLQHQPLLLLQRLARVAAASVVWALLKIMVQVLASLRRVECGVTARARLLLLL
jgi:hypothetical protein